MRPCRFMQMNLLSNREWVPVFEFFVIKMLVNTVYLSFASLAKWQ